MRGRFVLRETTAGGRTHRHRVWLPPGWSAGARWPVVLFLHGAGERGRDGQRPTEVGIGPALRAHPSRWPCVVVFPQCPTGRWWAEPEMVELALAATTAACADHGGDREHTVVTGVSMGGYGCWAVAVHAPRVFAAVAPVCGGWPWRARSGDAHSARVRTIASLPAWVFHGAEDPTVPVAESRKVVADLKAAAADVRYTEYPGVGHESWTPAYQDPALPAWLLALPRPAISPPSRPLG